MHFEGIAGQTTYAPEKGPNLTLYGAAHFADDSNANGKALVMNYPPASYAYSPGMFYALATKLFTLEFFIKLNQVTDGYTVVLECRDTNSNGVRITIQVGTDGSFIWYVNGASRIVAPVGTIPRDGKFHHFAYARDTGNVGRLFLDGQIEGTLNDTYSYGSAATIRYCQNSFGTAQVGCTLDAWRLTTDVCRYNANFVPPKLQ